MADSEFDWLEGDVHKPSSDTELTDEDRKELEAQFADLYRVFVEDPRAKQLLEHWTDQLFWKSTPNTADLNEYARTEGQRDFVRGIQGQLKLVQEGTFNT